MPRALQDMLQREYASLDVKSPDYAVAVVDRLLAQSRRLGASDAHLVPSADGLDIAFRVDGVLQAAARLPRTAAANVIARLKVLAELLTYRTDIPQEGRIRAVREQVEMRVSTFPTVFGEKTVVRLFAGAERYQRLEDLGLPDDGRGPLGRLLEEPSGAILATGPAGSGKTTTIYACMRDLAFRSASSRSLVSLEDPVEVIVPGVAQSQVNPSVQFDLLNGLRFLMRQDPEVIMVGEIRDRGTAEAAFGASLTGHLLLSTFHAGSAAEAISRLADMGIEPYLLQSGLLGILCQRLVRRLCTCARRSSAVEDRLGLPVSEVSLPGGCAECNGTGYRGRFVLVEMLIPERSSVGRAILSRSDAASIERLAIEAGMVSRWQRACAAVREGQTSPAEIRRVLGFSSVLECGDSSPL
jgi:general secretion pathway protein E